MGIARRKLESQISKMETSLKKVKANLKLEKVPAPMLVSNPIDTTIAELLQLRGSLDGCTLRGSLDVLEEDIEKKLASAKLVERSMKAFV